jgi:hypothetical protein
MGVGRSHQQVADILECSRVRISTISMEDKWTAKIKEIEARSLKLIEKEATETIAEIKERHLEAVRKIQRQALEQLVESFEFSNPKDAAKAAMDAIALEREILGVAKSTLDIKGGGVLVLTQTAQADETEEAWADRMNDPSEN